jgi:hypothetical protein
LIVEPRTAGDPMQEQLYWTDLCMAEISDELAQRGTPISPPTVKKLLNENGFSKRQIVKSIAGGSVPQRNQQFELLADLQTSYRSAKNPIFSIDTKKKELLGTLYRAGRVYSPHKRHSKRSITTFPVGQPEKSYRMASGIRLEIMGT